MSKLLDPIQGPEDLQALGVEQLPALCQEIREFIFDVISANGGHLASNLGVVELTVALHYCFDFSEDHLLWDVGHQCYVHKILTGRKTGFAKVRKSGGVSGFPLRGESVYDRFTVGHAGSAISTAMGIALGKHLAQENDNVIAVVGDASVVNGLAFEGLNNIGRLQRQLLVVLNDNSMAIDVAQGMMAKSLDRFRMSSTYMDTKERAHRLLEHIPLGEQIEEAFHHITEGIKTAITPGQIFEQLGIKYFGPVDGHDVTAMIPLFQRLREIDRPVMLHIHTEKGKGFDWSSKEPMRFHSPPAFKVNDYGDVTISSSGRQSWTKAFAAAIQRLMGEDERIAVLTAAMPDGTGVDKIRQQYPDRCFDVGICESHAVALSAGLAHSGRRPVAAIYSTFLQRGFDQIWQEVVVQDLPVVFAIDRAGLVGSDGAHHHGFMDVAYFRIQPHTIVCAPADEEELYQCLKFALQQDHPVALRYPRDDVPQVLSAKTAPFMLGKSVMLREGSDATLLAYGALVSNAMAAADLLSADGIEVGVVNARFAKPIDEQMISRLLGESIPLFTIEDHTLIGGLGSAVLEFAQQNELPASQIVRLGLPDRLIGHASRGEQLKEVELDGVGLANTVRRHLRTSVINGETDKERLEARQRLAKA